MSSVGTDSLSSAFFFDWELECLTRNQYQYPNAYDLPVDWSAFLIQLYRVQLFSYSVATRGYLTHLSFNSNIPWLIATELLLQFQTTKHLWFKIM